MKYQTAFTVMMCIYLIQIGEKETVLCRDGVIHNYFKNMLITFGIISYLNLMKIPIITHES